MSVAERMSIDLCGSIHPCTLVLEPRQTEDITIRFESDSGGTSKGFNLTCKAIKISKDILFSCLLAHVEGSPWVPLLYIMDK